MLLLQVLFVALMLLVGEKARDPEEKRIDNIEGAITELFTALKFMAGEIATIQNRLHIDSDDYSNTIGPSRKTLLNDTDLTERVRVLEFQMANVLDNIEDLNSEVMTINTDQLEQDERLLDVENEVDGIKLDVATLNDVVNELNTSNIHLNTSISQLNNGIHVLNEDIEDIDFTLMKMEEALTELNEITEAFNLTVIELDSRTSDLETNNIQIAFHAEDRISPIPVQSVIVFPNVIANLGNGYDNETGNFIVPSGGAGVYYFYFHTVLEFGDVGLFIVRSTRYHVCAALGDHEVVGTDSQPASCGGVVVLNEIKCLCYLLMVIF